MEHDQKNEQPGLQILFGETEQKSSITYISVTDISNKIQDVINTVRNSSSDDFEEILDDLKSYICSVPIAIKKTDFNARFMQMVPIEVDRMRLTYSKNKKMLEHNLTNLKFSLQSLE